MNEPLWIESEETLTYHNRQIAEHGGAAGLRDSGLLDSALARPKNVFAYLPETATLERLAASYAVGIISNHPFVDGNKRTAMVVAFAFLVANGRRITASQEAAYLAFLAVAAGRLKEEGLVDWLEQHSIRK